METGSKAAKTELREKAHAIRQQIRANELSERATHAIGHFFSEIVLDAGAKIGAFWPIRTEIDVRPLMMRLLDDGFVVGLPAVLEGDRPLQFRLWEVDAPLYPAGFGTLAPPESAPVIEPDVLIMPLLGFDGRGNRLGYGQGHYDRTIASMAQKPLLIGFAFKEQELDGVPAEPHDVPLDFVVTDAGVKRFKG